MTWFRENLHPEIESGIRIDELIHESRTDFQAIQIFRNDELYSQYPAENVDLLSSKESMAAFGLRHVGGDGSIAGAIDDARIYDKALTVDELKALEANKKSGIAPISMKCKGNSPCLYLITAPMAASRRI